MYYNPKRLRRPEERVGTLTNVSLPPPVENASAEADRAIVRSLRARNERAFADAVKSYYSTMLRLAITFVRTPDEANEVIQETWVAVLAGIHRFEARSSFKTWLLRILMNRARTRARREARMVPFSEFRPVDPEKPAAEAGSPFESHTPVWADAPSRTQTPEDQLLAAELRQRIDSAISRLPDTQQAIITMRDVEGRTAGEVCETLQLSASHQRVLLHRARRTVRAALQSYVS